MSTKPIAQRHASGAGTSGAAAGRSVRARSKGKAQPTAEARVGEDPFVSTRRMTPVPANDEPTAPWPAETARPEHPEHHEAAAMSALGEPIRRELVERLLDEPSSVGRLAENFPVSRAAISQHLKVLLDAGVVGYHKRGPLNIYSVRAEPLAQLESYVRELSHRARSRNARRSRWYEPA
jgi:DNA-binding transcriptional ArsR family regulator